MGEVYDQPRADADARTQVDASLRYQIMEIVDQIRWIPGFGYERELDWLLNMHDWMISKKRYWGLALPIYDCPACGTFDVVGGREELQRAGRRGLGGVRGPHAASAVRRRGHDRLLRRAARPSSGSRTSATPGWTPGIVPFSTLHYREDPEYWAQLVPGRLHHRELPRPVPQLVLLDARDVDGPPPRAAVQDDLRLRHALRRGRPADAQELGQRDRVRRGRRADGRRRHALDVRHGAARGQHPLRLARRRRGPARAARALERLRVLRDLRPARRLEPARRRTPARPRRRPSGRTRPLDPVAGGRARGRASGTRLARLRRASATARRSTTFIDDLSTWYLRLSRRRFSRNDDAADRDAAFATLHAALVALARMLAPILPFLAEAMYGNLVDDRRRAAAGLRPPDALAGRGARRRSATSASRRRWRPPGAPSS